MALKMRIGFMFIIGMLLSLAAYSAPMAGTYTIGGSSPNYSSFNAAVSDLLADGVNGPVIFNVRPGIYTEQVLITAITGASLANTVTFQSESGNRTDVTLRFSNTSTNNYVIRLDGASFVTIKDMTITSTEPTLKYGFVLDILNKGNNITISNNILNGLNAPAWESTHVIFAVNFTGSNLCIAGNVVNYGAVGICLSGKDNAGNTMQAIVRNNKVNNFFGWGISANYQNETVIENNEIATVSNPTYGCIPIYLQNNMNPVYVLKNRITVTGTNTSIAGMYIVNNHPTSLAKGMVIANNFVANGRGNAFVLINNDYTRFYYNSVYNITSNSISFTVYGNSVGNELANNIFYNSGNGVAISVGAPAAVNASDNNLLYSTGSNIGSWNGVNCANLTAWRSASGKDMNSRSFVPPFVSATDLHLTSFASLKFAATVSVTDDIDFTTRSTSPTVGADDSGAAVVINPNCCGCTNYPPAFTADATTVCAGGTIQFTDQTGNTPNAWRWEFPGGSPSGSLAQNPSVTYNMAGTYNVKLVVTNAGGTDSLTKNGYIQVNTGAEAGTVMGNPDTLCAGNASVLAINGSTGSIQWQQSAGGVYSDITGEDSAVYNTPALSQTTTYRWIVSNGNCVDTSEVFTLVVNPLPAPPVITATDTLICSSDSAQLQASGNYPYYNWNNGDSGNPVYVSSAGSYGVTVTDANGCTAESARRLIAVYPVRSVSIIVQGDTLTSFGAEAYQWIRNDTFIDGAMANVYIARQPAYYSVQVTDSNGCKATSSPVFAGSISIGEGLFEGQLLVYPNPFNNTVYLDNRSGIVVRQVEIYDLLGKKVWGSASNAATGVLAINLAALPTGMHYLKVHAGGYEFVRKIIKQ